MEEVKVPEQDIKEVKVVEKYKDKACKVLFHISGTLGVDFDGYGISFNTDEPVGDMVIVSYIGEIGKDNFKFKLK